VTDGSVDRRVELISAGIAGFVALLLVVVVPRGGDAAAHLYRTFLVTRGALLWDNLWFAGQYPLVSYSLLYYLPAAVLGNNVLAAAGVVLSAVLFAAIVVRIWGRTARWPAYSFALLAGGQFFTGDYPYTLGFTALLATLWALQRGRAWLAILCAGLTLGCSPLAFLFLCLALTALFLRSSQPRWREVVVALPIIGLASLEFAALSLFPSPHLSYPFTVWRLGLGVPVGVLGSALAFRSKTGRPLASMFIVWTAATVVSYLVPSPFGHNLLRPATLVFPLMLLAALLADFRPRWLAVPAVAAAFAANVGPYATTAVARADRAAKASFWAPLLGYVARRPFQNFRLEVVPTINHWEAYYVPKSGYAIARGWYQQLDAGDNPDLYRRPLTAGVYRSWLRSVGVRYVILARAAQASESVAEARLLNSGQSGLRRVFESRSGTIYELPHATPILTGPNPAAISSQSYEGIAGWVSRPGTYLLRVHYTPYWTLKTGALCLRRGRNDMTQLEVRRPGAFSLRVVDGGGTLLSIVLDRDAGDTATCAIHRGVNSSTRPTGSLPLPRSG
jgi:hypothetical protein